MNQTTLFETRHTEQSGTTHAPAAQLDPYDWISAGEWARRTGTPMSITGGALKGLVSRGRVDSYTVPETKRVVYRYDPAARAEFDTYLDARARYEEMYPADAQVKNRRREARDRDRPQGGRAAHT